MISVPIDTVTRVGIYTRTSILTDRYDSHETALRGYCQEHGWQNVIVYHDRVGGMIDEGKLERMIKDLLAGNTDPGVISELMQIPRVAQRDTYLAEVASSARSMLAPFTSKRSKYPCFIKTNEQ